MTDETIRLSREELYDLVWSEPMRTAAERFGISDVGLAKNCRKMNIPYPGRGYWAKKATGRSVRRAPLPKLPPNDTMTRQQVVFYPRLPVVDAPPLPAAVAEQIAFEDRPGNRIAVSEVLRSPHRLLRKSREALKGSAKKDGEFVHNWQDQHLDLQVTRGSLSRALRIMDALVKAFEKRGWPVALGDDRYRKSHVSLLGQRVPFGIREPIKKVANEPAKPVRMRDGRTYIPFQSKYRDEPTGRLSLVIRSHWEASNAVERTWHETTTRPLEDQLNDFIVGVVEYAQHWNHWEEERQKEERQRQEAERRRIEEQKRRETEAARAQTLERQAARWMISRQLVEYVAAVRVIAEQRPGGIEAGTPFAQWLEWAEQYAQSIDPLQQPLERLVAVPATRPTY